MRYIDALRREHGLPTRRRRAGVARPRRRAAGARAAGRVRVRAQRPPQAARQRRRPRDDVAGRHAPIATWRAGFAQLGAHGLRFDLQTPWWHLHEAARLAADFPDTTDHPQPHRAARRSQRRGHRRLEARDDRARRVPERRGQDLRPRPAGARRGRSTANRDIVRTVIDLFGVAALHVREQLPGRQPVRDVRDDLRRLPRRSSPTSPPHEQRALFRDNAIRIYAMPMSDANASRSATSASA